MNRILKSRIIIIALFAVVITAFIIFMVPEKPVSEKRKAESDLYYMKAKENTVALYKDDVLIKTYDGIVLDTLPIEDREKLKTGIEFESLEEADRSAEDYDG